MRLWTVVSFALTFGYLQGAEQPLRFEPNTGQAGAGVEFVGRGPRYGLAIDAGGATLALGREAAVLRMAWRGARKAGACLGLDPLPGVSNYLIGGDPSRWRTNVPNYARVECRGVYPGIDVVYYSAGRQLEYDLVIAAGSDARQARLMFPAPAKVRITTEGALPVRTRSQEGRLPKQRAHT